MLVLLALASSLVWGTTDFFAGVKSRTLPPAAVVGLTQAAALVVLTVLVLAGLADFHAEGWPLWSVAAGLAGSVGLVSFYAALASGTMGVVSPIAALGAIVPVTLGILGGERPDVIVLAGMLVAVAGAVLASGPDLGSAVSRRPIALAFVAAAGFGFALYSLDRGARSSLVHTLWGMRLTSVLLFAVAAVALRSIGSARRTDVPALVLIGLGDLVANVLFAYSSSRGLVSVSSVLGSLYPVATLLWARFLLGERLRRVQQAGVCLALAGVLVMNI